eukprot:m.43090 g.43090  ORF g.43090 m.43090 type:complete len:447 (-) comp7090_c0_seq1:270-1610(-)
MRWKLEEERRSLPWTNNANQSNPAFLSALPINNDEVLIVSTQQPPIVLANCNNCKHASKSQPCRDEAIEEKGEWIGEEEFDHDVVSLKAAEVVHDTKEPSRLKSMMKWIIFAAYLIMNGGGKFLQRFEVYRHGSGEVSTATYIAFVSGGMLLPLFIYSLSMLVHRHPSKLPFTVIWKGVLSGVLVQGGHTFYFLMTQGGGEASLLAPLVALWAVFPPIFFIVFAKEKITINKAIGLGLALLAIILFALASITTAGVEFKLEKSNLVYFICIVAVWGIGTTLLQTMSSHSSEEYNAGFFTFILSALISAILSIFFVFDGDVDTNIDVRAHMMTLGAAGVCAAGGNLTFMLMCKVMPNDLAIISPLSSTNVFVPIALGIALLGESTAPLKIGGMVAAVICVPLMAYKRGSGKNSVAVVVIVEDYGDDVHVVESGIVTPSIEPEDDKSF